MVDGRVGVLLYPFILFERICEARIPENIDHLELSRIFEMKSNGVVLYKYFQSIDMATEQLFIYKLRPGTQEEYEKCIS